MDFYGDYHTHTIYSHGKNTIFQNAFNAQYMGLKQIALTDHGFSHLAFGLTRRKVNDMKREINFIYKDFSIEILLGVESNLIGRKGIVDLKEEDYENFDIILCNFHQFAHSANFLDQLLFYIPNIMFFKKVPKFIKKMNTKALIQAVKKNKIDIITHINSAFLVDTYEVAKVCSDYGTYLEISGKKIGFSDEEFLKMAETGVKFIINSDAHKVSQIGNFQKALDILNRNNYPLDNICNYQKKPKFRSKNFTD